jgi:uncharacterized repeat protein (TIGR02543 family)
MTSDVIKEIDAPVIVHIDDKGKGEIVEQTKEYKLEEKPANDEVVFDSDAFSVYAIVEAQDDIHSVRVKYVFQNADGTEYKFRDNSGKLVDNQIIKNNEYLENVGIPTMNSDGQTFQGWYIYTADGTITPYRISFGQNISITTGAAATAVTSTSVAIADADNQSGANGTNPDYTVYVRPYFGDVKYITLYNEVDGNIIYSRIQVPVGAEPFDLNTEKAVPPDALTDDDDEIVYVSYAFTGWSRVPADEIETVGHPDTRTELTPPDTLISVTAETDEADLVFYPIFRLSHWVNFFSAPAGSGATYIPSVYVLSGQTAASAEPSRDPVWEGHNFVGWFTTVDDDYLSVDETDANAFNFDQELTEDITLYAHWNRGTANYTIIYWQQLVTDDKNYTDAQKNYEYGGQKNVIGTVNEEVTVGDAYESLKSVTIINEEGETEVVDKTLGYEYNRVKSDEGVIVKADGTSVINVYHDRKLIQMVFTGYGNSQGTYYTATTSNDGTQYGYVNGNYVRLTRSDTSTTTYPYTYTGYTATTSNSNNSTQYGIVNGEYVPLTRSGTNNNYTWSYGTGEYEETYTRTYGNNGTQYGIVDGEYVLLSRFSNQWHYVAGTANNGVSSLTPANNVTYYRNNNDSESQLYYNNGTWYRNRTGNYYSNPHTGDIYVRYSDDRYTLTSTEITEPYSEQRYTQNNSTTSYTGTRIQEAEAQRRIPIQ